MFEISFRKRVVINEQGTAEVIYRVRLRNKSDHPQTPEPFTVIESTPDMVNIRVKDNKGKSLPHKKTVEEGFVGVEVDLRGITLDANKTYDLILQFTLPVMARRFERSYFCKEVFSYSHPMAETCEWVVRYELPELFSRKEFWKEMYVNAPQASEIHTDNGRPEAIEYQFVVPRGSHREISFMFQERYNSKIISLLSFLLGIGLIQLFEWVLSFIF
jgi:hypothetical protein